MKRLSYSLLLLVGFVFSSCSNFLDEDNKSGITNEQFYKTAAGFETLMTASYNSLRDVYGRDGSDGPWVFMAGTDMYEISRQDVARGLMTYGELFPNDARVSSFYKAVYGGLQKINLGIKYIDNAEISDALKVQYRAELHCLRSFYHFLLIEQFGGIVINQEATQSAVTNMPRSSIQDSYNFVISEMEANVENLKDDNKRFGKYAGYHYLAKMYLTRGWDLNDQASFTKAKEWATKAINGKGISQSFEALWSPTNENNEEFLFSIQYDATSIPTVSSGNSQQAWIGSYLGGSELALKYTTTSAYPSWNLQKYFAANDNRYNGTFMTTIYEKYFTYYSPADTATAKIIAYYPRFSGRDYTTADSLAWAQKHAGRLITVSGTNPVKRFRYYPLRQNEADNRRFNANDFCLPVVKKFDSPKSAANFNTRASVRDIVLARRAETYFLRAEASIALNDLPSAEADVEIVTRRPGNAIGGGVLNPTINIATAGSQTAALESYLMESAKEFVGEYLRWPELRRTKMLKYMVGKYNFDIKQNGVENVLPGNDAKRYRPIPQDAIDQNEALSQNDQNPGY